MTPQSRFFRNKTRCLSTRSTHFSRARARTLRMTVLIVLAFICCWTPNVVMSMWSVSFISLLTWKSLLNWKGEPWPWHLTQSYSHTSHMFNTYFLNGQWHIFNEKVSTSSSPLVNAFPVDLLTLFLLLPWELFVNHHRTDSFNFSIFILLTKNFN